MNLIFWGSALLSVSGSYGFHPQAAPPRYLSPLSVVPKKEEVVAPLDLRKTVASIAIAATLAWGVAGGAAFAADDFVDFSLPSYEAVSRAELNSNLKGDNFLLGEESKASSSSSEVESVAAPSVQPAVQIKSADQIKAEKAAQKAAEKEARERQKAAVEAAAKAAS
mmetsp:Transcript_16256/g.23908  ORF Transcript_16256/g.23908 Transcript_16256/m.23908 type:complete len:166 (-) Transcript_16256:223-720(-)|eukprot:CAMPEP_0194200870 /NCGR_PEP_ID=MMETSP0156-20130528/1313_1 /TAXON_ID=33649 /ORGANISM="Thalassionema nitzschioides, Strain L26-B" /LENGTH=165 /DNA_ID=CAMNT_0038925935 /DNA_START=29 /DNA_END=526 /DNA_ORIENTATION=-